MLKRVLSRIHRSLTATRLNFVGRWQYLRGARYGSYELPYETFHTLLDTRPRSFTAHFYLGQIARERGMARLAFDHYLEAYRLSQSRFDRTRLPDDLKNHIALRHGLIRARRVVIHELDQTPAALHQDDYASSRGSKQPEGPERHSQPAACGPDLCEFDDLDRAATFANRPAISTEELDAVDLDALITKLMADQ